MTIREVDKECIVCNSKKIKSTMENQNLKVYRCDDCKTVWSETK